MTIYGARRISHMSSDQGVLRKALKSSGKCVNFGGNDPLSVPSYGIRDRRQASTVAPYREVARRTPRGRKKQRGGVRGGVHGLHVARRSVARAFVFRVVWWWQAAGAAC